MDKLKKFFSTISTIFTVAVMIPSILSGIAAVVNYWEDIEYVLSVVTPENVALFEAMREDYIEYIRNKE